MVRWDAEYLRNLLEASPFISSVLIALVPVSLFVGMRYYRPVLERVDTMPGIAILLCSLGAYAVGSYLGYPELHLVALAGVYLGFVVILGGRTHMFPVTVSLLPVLALVLPAIAPGLVATAVQLAVLASVSVFVLARWKRPSMSSERCKYCASNESSGSQSCLYCGRFISRDRPRIPMSMLAIGGVLSIVLIILASVSVPVLTVTGTGVNYTTAGFAGMQPVNPIAGSGSWTLGGVSSHAYPGLGMAFLYPVKGAGENLTFWEIVSPFHLSIVQLSTILPGLMTDSTSGTFGNISLPVFAWTYENRSFTGFYGATAASVVSSVTKSQVSIAYLVGVEGQIPGDGGSSLAKQVVPVVAGRLSNAQKYSFLVSAAQFPSKIGVYLQAVGGVAVLLGVLGLTRGRALRASRIMENTEGLSRSDFELFATLSSSGGEGTGQEILERASAKLGITSWNALLAKLQRFRELDLVETRLRVSQGVPSLKWVCKVR
ncbi:MAG: hypothetical protein ABSB29_06680 [Nitrososphaerales archaeon]|jgi:hypothetical protein